MPCPRVYGTSMKALGQGEGELIIPAGRRRWQHDCRAGSSSAAAHGRAPAQRLLRLGEGLDLADKHCRKTCAGTKLHCNPGQRHAQGSAAHMGLQHCTLSQAQVGTVQRQGQPQTLLSCRDGPMLLTRTQHPAGAGTPRSPAMLHRWARTAGRPSQAGNRHMAPR